jgi:hypothetical protein
MERFFYGIATASGLIMAACLSGVTDRPMHRPGGSLRFRHYGFRCNRPFLDWGRFSRAAAIDLAGRTPARPATGG